MTTLEKLILGLRHFDEIELGSTDFTMYEGEQQAMATTNYERYLVRKPIYEAGPGVKNRQSPTMTYMSRAQVPEEIGRAHV